MIAFETGTFCQLKVSERGNSAVKMAYEKVRGWTLGRRLPEKTLVEYPTPSTPTPDVHFLSSLPHTFIDIRIVFYMHHLCAIPVSIIKITDIPANGK